MWLPCVLGQWEHQKNKWKEESRIKLFVSQISIPFQVSVSYLCPSKCHRSWQAAVFKQPLLIHMFSPSLSLMLSISLSLLPHAPIPVLFLLPLPQNL